MKKIIIRLSLIASTILFGATQSYTTQFLDTTVQDAYDIHNTFQSKTLQEYTQEVAHLEEKISNYLQTQTGKFSSKEDAQKALDDVERLSTQITILAKTTAYLASHQTDNANESYNNTIQTTSQTILRLSDDIGTMADRIGVMADRIGVMADRIIKTQEIQSANYNATLKLAKYAMNVSNTQVNSTRNLTSMPTQNNMQNMNQNYQQGTIQMH
ncbi:hypothetical protein [Sulfurimonas sp.]